MSEEENAEEQKEQREEKPEELPEKPSEEELKEKANKKKIRKRTAKKSEKAEKGDEPEEGVVAEGDFLLVEMTGSAVETGEVFDTTDEETARSEDIYQEDRTYGPKLVVVGEGWVLKGLDNRLTGLKVKEDAEVEIPPEEAFGERSPENVRMMPYRVLRSKGVNPTVGSQVEIDGRTATVRSVGAGRVQLDYNHPLAGRRIVYKIRTTKRFEDDQEKIRALISRRFLGIDVDKFKLKMLKKKVRIQIPDEVFFGENIQIAKRGVALDIQRYFPDISEVEYTEVIKRSG
jgi:peptidylprolyl isomerase